MRSSCNTRKLKDKRDRRHTAGIIIHAKPCGKIPHVDELFNCESINQVYGSVIEFLCNLDRNEMEKIKIWLFDDMCHLKPYSEKEKQAKQNEITSFFSMMPKAVDRFHFPGHKKTRQILPGELQSKCGAQEIKYHQTKHVGLRTLNFYDFSFVKNFVVRAF